MRVNMSATGSCIVISLSSSPTRLHQTGHVAAHRRFAQLRARETELAIHATRPPGDGTAPAPAVRTRVARQLLQLDLRVPTLVVRCTAVVDDLFQRLALRRVLRLDLAALLLAFDNGCLRHA